MKRMSGWLAVALVLGGCKADSSDPADPDEPSVEPVDLVAPERVLGVPNIDDDLDVGGVDFDGVNPEDEDMTPLVITPSVRPDLQLSTWTLRLEGPVEHLRVWHGDTVLLDAEQAEAELPWSSDPLELRVEFARPMLKATLHLSEHDSAGEAAHPVEIDLQTGPLLLNHHLQPTERVYMMGPIAYADFDNRPMFNYLSNALGSMFEAVPAAAYDFDVWVQDEVQHAYLTAPDQRADLMLDSIRDRGLKGWADDRLRGPGMGAETIGSGWANTLDAFGNLEVSPPVDGYPFGRIYYGGRQGVFMPGADELFSFLSEQGAQDPFLVDTVWLCVAHVDEFMTFVPDSTAPRGFRFVYSDVDLGFEILDEMAPSTSLPMYAPNYSHGYATVNSIQRDGGLRNFNNMVRDAYLLPILDQMIEELGLLEEEVIRFPAMFEQVPGCDGTAGALLPGMLNLLQVNLEGGESHSFIADPFMRSNLGDHSSDPFIDAAYELLPEESQLHFVDNFDVYHLGLGEVHCGTNDIRTPTDAWWDYPHLGVQ